MAPRLRRQFRSDIEGLRAVAVLGVVACHACGVIADKLEMWRDDNHITATCSAFLGPAVGAELAQVTGPS
jgi:peptidoglycan/LPS O-acetylase OafA/YrhL